MKRNMVVPTIIASGFTLRPFCHGDASSLQQNINNPKVARRVSNIPYPYTIERAHEWINAMESWIGTSSKRVDFAIDIDGDVVGSVAFINLDGHKAQVSYWLGEAYWGRGIITEAVQKLIAFGFEEMKLVRIFAYVYHHNKASMRVLEKAGFGCEGVHRKEWFKDGEYYDSHYYAVVSQG